MHPNLLFVCYCRVHLVHQVNTQHLSDNKQIRRVNVPSVNVQREIIVQPPPTHLSLSVYRRMVALTATLAGASLTAQTCLHAVLQVTVGLCTLESS
jgi:hypothetical protein